MALNFPPDPLDKTIYVDPASGLKYIFNGSIGGWETAIQPPVITIGENPPDIQMEGFLWWNHLERILYVYKGGDWLPVVSGGGSGFLGVPVVCAPAPPTNAREGWLWWDSVGGNMYVYYIDPPLYDITGLDGSGQWVPVTVDIGSGRADAHAIVSGTEPDVKQDGLLWYNTTEDLLYIWDASVEVWQFADSYVAGIDGVDSVFPIEVSVDPDTKVATVSIVVAAFDRKGSVRFADPNNSSDDDSDKVAVSPSYLKGSIATLLPTATDTQKGIVRLATDLDDTDGVVTSGVLKENSDAGGFTNPVGTVIMFAADRAPVGYLICNGDSVPNGMGTVQGVTSDFTKLYNVLGSSYSVDGSVKLPDTKNIFTRGYSSGSFGQSQSIPVAPGSVSDTRIDSISFTYCIKY